MARVAVIGVGNMGKNHARVYSELKGVELVGVVDKDEKTGREVAKKFGVQYFLDYKELIGRVDAVSIVVPTKLHYTIAKDLLSAGIDVLVEKPITLDLKEADELIRLADAKKRILQVGHIERFNPAMIQARDYILPEEIIHMEAQRIGPSGARITDSGVILDLMIHDIDLMLSIAEGDVEGTHAYSRAINGRHEDFSNAILRFKGGVLASLTASRATQKRERVLKVTQKDSYVVVDFMNKQLEIHKQARSEYVADKGGVRFVYSDVVERPQIPQSEPLKLELESFVECVGSRKRPVVDGLAGRRALEIALKVLAETEK